MQERDLHEFTVLLSTAMEIYGKKITPDFARMFFAALRNLDIAQARAALDAHMQDPEAGRFPPKPADLIGHMRKAQAQDGRPERDEAWGIALRSLDEWDSVMVTPEILQALAAAQPALQARDKVAARLAFVQAYDRLVKQARDREPERNRKLIAAGKPIPPLWTPSFGTNAERRAEVLVEAERDGKLGKKALEHFRSDALQLEHQGEIESGGRALLLALTCDTKTAQALAGGTGDTLSREVLQERLADLRQAVLCAQAKRDTRHDAKVKAVQKDLEDRKRKSAAKAAGRSK